MKKTIAFILGSLALIIGLHFKVDNAEAQMVQNLLVLQSGNLAPISNNWGFKIGKLAGGGTLCLHVDNNGLIGTVSGDCATGMSGFTDANASSGVAISTSTTQISIQNIGVTSIGNATGSVATSTILTGYSTSTGANPTASVGLTATNGSANTFMRSDAAPALSQSISPTWTGVHNFNSSTNFNATTTNASNTIFSALSYGVVIASSSQPITSIAPGSNANVLTSNGSTWSSAALPTHSITITTTTLNFVKQLDATSTQTVDNNSAASTSFYSFSVPANTLSLGKILYVAVAGSYYNGAPANGNFTLLATYGGTQCVSALTAAITTSTQPGAWTGIFNIQNASGTTNNQICGYQGSVTGGSSVNDAGNGTSTVDSTQAQTLTLYMKANAANTSTTLSESNTVTTLNYATTTVVTNVTYN